MLKEKVLKRKTSVLHLFSSDGRVTALGVVEFLNTVRVQFFDYAAVSSGMVTSSVLARSSAMECSLK